MSRYVNVITEVDVDLILEAILDGLSEENLQQVIADAQRRIAGKAPNTKAARLNEVEDAVQRRHYTEHEGPTWMCKDPICDAWERADA